ncbi:actin-like ATPase domain-containing protein [Mollisia scopiformis]|uniref:Actin-like ATPase domain-containing protein n=1 Tax=Mollisia scopiformis TaxID=149040 RepID=A0A194X363_MOLSC|nr:actin-like ATPase domain-containing protein [Mollisia scopiformis]KUJ14621.1 actin-like ATPase domain-containing protein [Mollisia scopiformis]
MFPSSDTGSPPQSRMTSRHSSVVSTTSSRSSVRKPSLKAKPSALQGNLLNHSDDFLNENLLEDDEEISMSESPRISHRTPTYDAGNNRLVIAIDYGTTFTGVAYALPRSDYASLDEVLVVDNWGPQMNITSKIPSIYSYSPATSPLDQQWGASISDDSVTMVNTKMELDVQEKRIDELELILQVLEGTSNLDFEHVKKSQGYPEYTWKDPEEIVTDYLTKVFQYLDDSFEFIGEHLKSKIAVDIVVTVPVRWSYRARNSTIRAIKEAGFNELTYPNLENIIMVTEPVAAAIYTARHLKEDKKVEFLKEGECFVLCDAGGGTVDCVSYKVTQLEPTLELEEVTTPTSDKCGSSYIDAKFKRWLRTKIGERNYAKLDPRSAGSQIGAHTMEEKPMRQLIKRFDERKRAFSNKPYEVHLDLPLPLHTLNIPGRVTQGDLRITHDEMKTIFETCVDGVIELIKGQIQQVERKKYRVKNVFLVGGFGESQYLQEELRESLKLRKIVMRRPEKNKSWTAVVQGAVLYGIEKAHHKDVTTVATCTKSYGVNLNEMDSISKYSREDVYVDPVTNNSMARTQLTWLIRKGDLILSDEKREAEKEFMHTFSDPDDRKFKLPVYEYSDDDLPDRYETGQNELGRSAVLSCDLSTFSLNEFVLFRNPTTKRPYYVAYLVCRFIMCETDLEVEIRWKERVVCSEKIKMESLRFGL